MPESFLSASGIRVDRFVKTIPFESGLDSLRDRLNRRKGIYFSSSYESPGRHQRWAIAGVAPSLEIVSAGREVEIRALNRRGEVLNRMLEPVLAPHPHWQTFSATESVIRGTLQAPEGIFPEEQRSKQPSAFSILRTMLREFEHPLGAKLGLIGAFGYDLLLQFDPIRLRMPRQGLYDLRLFFCDELYFLDRQKEKIERYRYEFTRGEVSTLGLKRTADRLKRPKRVPEGPIQSDHTPEEYQANVETVREGMRRGDYYEVVLCQQFRAPYAGAPSDLFQRIQRASPSPYEFLFQFGEEQLIGASPEIFVRVNGRRVESSPIAGTTRRTGDPMRDAENIRALLASPKEESELTMCTDVDRNDKSRVCIPGSVQVTGRRTMERFAGVFHTVDYVEGTLAEGFDALDAFLTHMWSVTIIGAPKKGAAQAIEDLEKEPRGWYTGAIGMLAFDGTLNTGITIRTIHLRDGVARYGAGATLLYDSIPENEDRECHIKATGFFRALEAEPAASRTYRPSNQGRDVRGLLVEQPYGFTLANYVRQTGAEVFTCREGHLKEEIDRLGPSLLLISSRSTEWIQVEVPVFGIGLEGIVKAFGGEVRRLAAPVYGKSFLIRHDGQGVFAGLPPEFRAGCYHSHVPVRESMPACLEITAESEDGSIMGIRHRELPIEAVQFHPESILSLEGDCGLRLVENAVVNLGHKRPSTGARRT